MKRHNLHVAKLAALNGGIIIVDSTRKGKRFPDSFSRTIPIWCCVVNTWVYKFRQSQKLTKNSLEEAEYWTKLWMPTWVSKNEAEEVQNKVADFVDLFQEQLKEGGLFLKEMENLLLTLKSPLRPMWECCEYFFHRQQMLPWIEDPLILNWKEGH